MNAATLTALLDKRIDRDLELTNPLLLLKNKEFN